MKRDNYALQVRSAQERFLTYDQAALLAKTRLRADSSYIYPRMLGSQYRLDRHTGDLQRQVAGQWIDANTFYEVMTLLDFLCDSREDRSVAGRWVSHQQLGRMFHRTLIEEEDPAAVEFDKDPAGFHRVCQSLGGRPFPGADIGYAIAFFEKLEVAVQLWHSDEEFPPRLRILWDENVLQYIRYETTHFAAGLLRQRLREGLQVFEK